MRYGELEILGMIHGTKGEPSALSRSSTDAKAGTDVHWSSSGVPLSPVHRQFVQHQTDADSRRHLLAVDFVQFMNGSLPWIKVGLDLVAGLGPASC